MTATTTTTTPSTTTTPVWLVAHDFSACADAAADLALDDLLDSRRGGKIVLHHAFLVLLPPATFEPVPSSEFYRNVEAASSVEARRALERVAERLRNRQRERFSGPLPVEIEVAVSVGAPAEAIVTEATARNAARIVVGTHGRRGVAHALLGSVAERVVRMSQIPVVVAHAPAAPASGGKS